MNNHWMKLAVLAVSAGALAVSACGKSANKAGANKAAGAKKAGPVLPVKVDKGMLAAFGQLPKGVIETPESKKANPVTDAKVKLGHTLYFDKRLSKGQQISCNTCHDLAGFGVDTRAVSKKTSQGHKGQFGPRNSHTVYNAAGHVAQFWDGRSPDVEHQATQPVLNPVEMAMPSGDAVVAVLKSIPGYAEPFKAAFPEAADPITYENMGKAIGAYERKLVTPSRWDKFLAGDAKALTEAEKAGFNAFVQTGCVTCHAGPYVGAANFQKLGAVKPWPNQKDQGKFEETKKPEDKMMFKAMSLRNIEKTAPYFHDGSVTDLKVAVKMMADHQLGKQLSDKQADKIVTWLKTLTGDPTQLGDLIKEPKLPPSGPTTPKPDPT